MASTRVFLLAKYALMESAAAPRNDDSASSLPMASVRARLCSPRSSM